MLVFIESPMFIPGVYSHFNTQNEFYFYNKTAKSGPLSSVIKIISPYLFFFPVVPIESLTSHKTFCRVLFRDCCWATRKCSD